MKSHEPELRFESRAPLRWEAAFENSGIPVVGDSDILASNELAAIGWNIWKTAMLVMATFVGIITLIVMVALLRK